MVGGAEWYVYNISTELVKMGHEVPEAQRRAQRQLEAFINGGDIRPDQVEPMYEMMRKAMT